MNLVVKELTFISWGFLKYLYKYHFWSQYSKVEKIYTVSVAITEVKLTTACLPTRLACWRNSALASPFSTIYMQSYMREPIVTFVLQGSSPLSPQRWSILQVYQIQILGSLLHTCWKNYLLKSYSCVWEKIDKCIYFL